MTPVIPPQATTPHPAFRAVTNADAPAREQITEIAIQGMTCASCVGRVERAIAQVPGVHQASVNLATERAQVRHSVGAVVITDLEVAIERAGYRARRLPVER